MKKFFNIVYKYWMKFAHVLATINGFIILFAFYFIIIGLYAIVQKVIKLFSKEVRPESYWHTKEETGEGIEDLTYQF